MSSAVGAASPSRKQSIIDSPVGTPTGASARRATVGGLSSSGGAPGSSPKASLLAGVRDKLAAAGAGKK